MQFTCEIVAHRILPGLRATISKELMETYKLTQNQVAQLLDISQPAVSQYIRDLRGEKKNFFEDAEIKQKISSLCKNVYDQRLSKTTLVQELRSTCKFIVEKKFSDHTFASCGHLD